MTITGGCYCGEIRYESKGEPQAMLQCHCRECQYISGGNANLITVLPADGFSFTKGEPKSFTRTDIERPVTRLFCPTCGTSIATKTPNRPDSVIVKRPLRLAHLRSEGVVRRILRRLELADGAGVGGGRRLERRSQHR